MQSSSVLESPAAIQRGAYAPDAEDIPMTFQIGIVGTDGVLLASDECYIDPGLGQGARTRYRGQKIFIRGDGQIAYCAAGDDWAAMSAERHSDSFTGNLVIYQNMVLAREFAIDDCLTRKGKFFAEENRHGTVLAVHREPKVELWHMDVMFRGQLPICISDRVCIGDTGNPAVFFLERYLPPGAKLSLDKLKFLAAHSIAMAEKINPTGIGGLEMVLCREDRFERVSAEEINYLKSQSEDLDSSIANALSILRT